MVCKNCGELIKGATYTNQCPKCRKTICPQCGNHLLDPSFKEPADENDTVGLVFGMKPYWICRECGHEFKDSMLIKEENPSQEDTKISQKGIVSLVASGILFILTIICNINSPNADWGYLYFISIGFLILSFVGIIKNSYID